jgi:hypothetical protein
MLVSLIVKRVFAYERDTQMEMEMGPRDKAKPTSSVISFPEQYLAND